MDKHKERWQMAFQIWFYSIQRMDLLIISIGGAGIYVSLMTLQYIVEHNLTNSCIIKISGGFFLISIIFNFLSQHTGQTASWHDMVMYDLHADLTPENKEEMQKRIDEEDKYAKRFSRKTDILNDISMYTMFAGLITLLIYLFITF